MSLAVTPEQAKGDLAGGVAGGVDNYYVSQENRKTLKRFTPQQTSP